MPDPAARRTRAATVAMGARSASLLALLLTSALALLAGCGARAPQAPGPSKRSDSAASDATIAANRKVAESLPLADPQDFEDARRGFVATDDPLVIKGPEGRNAWDMSAYAFVDGDAPPTVNPSLWRQAKLDGPHGLFKVADGIHQVRGYDLSNMTIIDGQHGLDHRRPADDHRDGRGRDGAGRASTSATSRSSAVIFTHSHVDHFGGVAGRAAGGPGRGRGDSDRRAEGLHGRGDQRERAGRRRDGPSRALHVRRRAAARSRRATWTPGSARRRRPARSASDRRLCSSTTRRRTWKSTACGSCSSTRRSRRRRRN